MQGQTLNASLTPVPEAKPVDSGLRKWWQISKIPELSYPGKLDDFSREAAEIVGDDEFYEGARLEYKRNPSQYFTASHIFNLGGSDNVKSYSFIPQIASRDQKLVAFGRFDSEGRVMGRAIYNISKRWTGSLQAQVSNDPQGQPVAVGDVEYKGNNSSTVVRLEPGGCLNLSFAQSLHKNLFGGISMVYVPHSGTVSTWGLRYARGRDNDPKDPKHIFGVIASPSQGSFGCNYALKTGKKADFATEFAFRPTQDGSFRSEWSAACVVGLSASKIKGRVDHNARINILVEHIVLTGLQLSMSTEMLHLESKYKFGIGLSFSA